MPRRAPGWHRTEAACCHVINRGHARETVLHDGDRARFLQLLEPYRDRFGLRIYHYCPMGRPRLIARLMVAY